MADAGEQLIFRTPDGAQIDDQIDRFATERLGAGILHVLSRSVDPGVVLDVRLTDNRQVRITVHPAGASRPALLAIHDVQAHLHGSGFPCPSPLLGPTALGSGFAVVEEFVDYGERQDTHDAKYRCLMAEALAEHLDLTRELAPEPVLADGWTPYASGAAWPFPASAAVTAPESTAPESAVCGPEWIDELVAAVKPQAEQPSQMLIGHTRWNGENVRFNAGRVTVIHDWGSVRLRREAHIVGAAAMSFGAGDRLDAAHRPPSPDEARAFIDEYGAARTEPLSAAQRRQISASAMLLAVSRARAEHRIGPEATTGATSFTTALRTHGLAYLQP